MSRVVPISLRLWFVKIPNSIGILAHLLQEALKLFLRKRLHVSEEPQHHVKSANGSELR